MDTITYLILFIFIGIPLIILALIRIFWPIVKTYLYASHQDKFISAQHTGEDLAIRALTSGTGIVSFLLKLAVLLLAIYGLSGLVMDMWHSPGNKGIKALGTLVIIGFLSYAKLSR